MSVWGPSDHGDLKSSDDWALLNEICDRFETALRSGFTPSFSEQLAAVPEHLRGDLALELTHLITTIPTQKELPGQKFSAAKSAELSPNRSLFDRFLLIRYLGCGGFGFVFLSEHKESGKQVALKIARPEIFADRKMKSLFLREAKTAQKLESPYLGRILDAGEFAGSAYIVSEYEPGPSLKQLIAESNTPLDCRWSAWVAREIAQGIQHAHESGVIHCDINPGNVIIGGSKESVPKVVDFGIAKVLGEPSELSRTGELFGTPGFIAPEQAAGQRGVVDCRTDVYGIGAVLYACLVGRPPFQAENALQTLTQVLRDDVSEPRSKRGDVPSDLQAICLKCLEKDPSRRFLTVKELAEDLGRFLEGRPTFTRPASFFLRLNRWTRKQPILASLGMASVLITIAGMGFLIWHNFSLVEINQNLTAVTGKLQETNDHLKTQQMAVLAQARRSRLEAYAADIRQAANLLESADFTELQNRLKKWQPAHGEEDLRGFEWHYLKKQGEPRTTAPLWSGDKAIYAIAYSPEGDKIAVAGADRMLRLIDAHSGIEVQTPREHPGEIGCIDYSQTNLIATTCIDGIARIWKPTGGPPIELRGHSGKLLSLAISPDGKSLVTGGFDKKILLWDLSKLPPQSRELGKTDGHITALVWEQQGDRIFSGEAEQGIVKCWDIKSGTNYFITNIYSSSIVSIHHISEVIFTTVFKIGIINQFLLDEKSKIYLPAEKILQVGLDRINGSAVSPNGSVLALAREGRVELWDLAKGELINFFRAHTGRDWSVSFSPDGKTVASGGVDGSVRIWPVGRSKPSIKGLRRINVNTDVLAAGFNESSSSLQWKAYEEPGLHTTPVQSAGQESISTISDFSRESAFKATSRGRLLAIHPSGQIVGFSDQGRPEYVGKANHPNARRLREMGGWLISDDCSWIATHDADQITIVDIVGRAPPLLIPAHQNTGKIAASSKRLFAASYPIDKLVVIFNADTGDQYFKWHLNGNTWNIEFSPDGNKLAVSVAGTIRILDIASKKEDFFLKGLRSENLRQANMVSFSPDGRTIATPNIDGSIDLWQAEIGQPLLSIKLNDKPITELFFSPDGTCIATVVMLGINIPRSALSILNIGD